MSDGHLTIPPDQEHDHRGLLHDDHHHGDGHDHALPLMEEGPLDPASQSLADALRSSFRLLKFVMFGLLILFLFSGVFTVGTNEVAVVTRFGRQRDAAPAEPGLHFAWPYPIDSVTKVNKGLRTTEIDAFWLKLSDADKTKDLSQVSFRSGGLDPATDGALITGDQALMHMLLRVQYHVSNAGDFIKNVSDENNLIRTLVQQSVVAEAARSTLDTIWKEPSALLPRIQDRVQGLLDGLGSGMKLESQAGISVEKSHYPLQVRDAFSEVSDAENKMRATLQEANKKREDTLKGAAGPAWEEIYQQIELLDQTTDDSKRSEAFEKIGQLLTDKATGEAGKKIKIAEGQSSKIVDQARAAQGRFLTMLDAYHKSPLLVTSELRAKMLQQIFSQALSRWWLPPGGNKFILLNKNPQEIRRAEREAAKKKVGVR